MQPVLRSPVPSRSLLRFLRSQSEDAFAAPGRRHGLTAAEAPHCRRARIAIGHTGTISRSITTSTVRQRVLGPTLGKTLSIPTIPAKAVRGGPTSISSLKLGFCTSSPKKKLFEPDQPRAQREPTWQERLWGSSAKKGAKPLKPDDLPAHDDYDHGSSMFTSRRVLSAKAALEPRLRCTEVDENGKVILVDGEFKKTELIAKVSS